MKRNLFYYRTYAINEKKTALFIDFCAICFSSHSCQINELNKQPMPLSNLTNYTYEQKVSYQSNNPQQIIINMVFLTIKDL